MAVGDVSSNEKGSGARYNDGKVPLGLIPARVLAQTVSGEAQRSLILLAQFEENRRTAASVLSGLSRYWIIESAFVFAYGAKKYAAWNWAKGMPWSVPIECAKRHAFLPANMGDVDDESKLPHYAHFTCNLIMLAHYELHYREGDDRPPVEIFA